MTDVSVSAARAGFEVVRGLDAQAMYRAMLRIRRVEERILALRREEAISGSVHVCVGQESVPVGVVAALDHRDKVLSTYRGHGWALALGVPAESLLAECLGRETGTNGGRSGSPYLSSPEHGFIGENSIVGAGLPVAGGVAMALNAAGENAVAVVSFGDGATNQGASHEALVFAIARRLPVVFVCENNQWSEMTPITDTVPNAQLADRAAGYGLPTQIVDGSDVAAVFHAAQTAVQHARSGGGPSFLEVRVPRILGHYNGDVEHYRTADDRATHAKRDPIARLRDQLLADGAVDAARLESVEADVETDLRRREQLALAGPLPDPASARDHVYAPAHAPATTPFNPDAKALRYGLAVNRALDTELSERPEVVLFGEDIAIPGGTFGVTRNLRKRFGERVFDTPISESAILGAAVGASVQGLRPVVEIMWTDFVFVALDQIVNQAANVRYIARGTVSAPMVIRMQQGITPGSCAQHSQSMEALLAHIPGIKVGMPSNPQDAYAMIRAAIADLDPVVIIESRALYQLSAPVDTEAPVEPVGGARVHRHGGDLLVITWGRMTQTCLAAAERLAEQGIFASVLDLRWLTPLDEDQIAANLGSGKVLIVHEANLTGGFGAEIGARLAEHHFDKLRAPVRRIGLPDVRVPSAPTLQEALLPDTEQIVSAATELHTRQP
ncbi:alpha-ketoacid dehydrogenase subunit alpha/beta [Streptomyces sp. NPDC004752]